MCQLISGYVTEKRGMRCNPFISSHSDQIILFGDEDLDAKRPLGLCKWECTPPEEYDDFWDVSKWDFFIDQDEIPDWCDPKMLEYDVRELVQGLLDKCPDTTDKEIKLLDGRHIAIKGDGLIYNLSEYCVILYARNAKIRYASDAHIRYADNALIEHAENARIEHAENARIDGVQYRKGKVKTE